MAQHTETVGWVPEANGVAAMERKVRDGVTTVRGRGGVLSGPTGSRPWRILSGPAVTPPGRVSENTGPGVRLARGY